MTLLRLFSIHRKCTIQSACGWSHPCSRSCSTGPLPKDCQAGRCAQQQLAMRKLPTDQWILWNDHWLLTMTWWTLFAQSTFRIYLTNLLFVYVTHYMYSLGPQKKRVWALKLMLLNCHFFCNCLDIRWKTSYTTVTSYIILRSFLNSLFQ